MSATPSNDVLFDRMERFSKQLEEHRDEARANAQEERRANEATQARLDEIARLATRVQVIEERTDALDATVNGEKDEPGMKGRLDRAEQRIEFGVWIVCAVTLGLLSLIFEWMKRAFPGGTH